MAQESVPYDPVGQESIPLPGEPEATCPIGNCNNIQLKCNPAKGQQTFSVWELFGRNWGEGGNFKILSPFLSRKEFLAL